MIMIYCLSIITTIIIEIMGITQPPDWMTSLAKLGIIPNDISMLVSIKDFIPPGHHFPEEGDKISVFGEVSPIL